MGREEGPKQLQCDTGKAAAAARRLCLLSSFTSKPETFNTPWNDPGAIHEKFERGRPSNSNNLPATRRSDWLFTRLVSR
jgi:hypothetical protein